MTPATRSARPAARPRALVLAAAIASVSMVAACTSPAPDAAAPTSTVAPAPAAAGPGGTGTTTPASTTGSAVGTIPPDGIDPASNPTLGIGTDESFPKLGSSAYDVRHYDLELDYDPDTNDLEATATIEARANRPIEQISLDFDGLTVRAVTVDGEAADFTVDQRKLVVDAPSPIPGAKAFTVAVDYDGKPRPRSSLGVSGVEVGWHGGKGGSFVVSEPEGASTWYPVNNHPRDKATYSFAITVPKPYSAIANGSLDQTESNGDARTFHWTMDKPMANYLSSVVTGEYTEVRHREIDGVAYSDWIPDDIEVDGEVTGDDAVQALAAKLGPFPFATYGGVVYPASFVQGSEMTEQFLSGVALEVQGRSLYSEFSVSPHTVVHEAAHQWMGNNVSVTDWSKDIWWVEGFARFAETAFADEDLRRDNYATAHLGCRGETPGDLPISELFGKGSYVCGSLTFYALQQEVGEETFWKILRTFNERYRYSNASTDDLIATASDVAGKDLSAFFEAWLFGPLPELPE